MYECFYCGHQSVCLDSDYSLDDVGIEGEGIIYLLHCENCAADIEYRIRFDGDDDE